MHLFIPILLLFLILSSLFMGTGVYDSFIRGAKSALPLMLQILPYMAAMLCALNIFRDSGALFVIEKLLSPVMSFFGIPDELMTLIMLRPFSGSAAIALLGDVYKTVGVDSYQGFMASVMLGSTETVFYTVTLYFGSIGVKKTRHAVPAALISAVAGIAASVILTKLMYP